MGESNVRWGQTRASPLQTDILFPRVQTLRCWNPYQARVAWRAANSHRRHYGKPREGPLTRFFHAVREGDNGRGAKNGRSVFKVVRFRQGRGLAIHRFYISQNSKRGVEQTCAFGVGEDSVKTRWIKVCQLFGEEGIVCQREDASENSVVYVTRVELVCAHCNHAILRVVHPKESSQKQEILWIGSAKDDEVRIVYAQNGNDTHHDSLLRKCCLRTSISGDAVVVRAGAVEV